MTRSRQFCSQIPLRISIDLGDKIRKPGHSASRLRRKRYVDCNHYKIVEEADEDGIYELEIKFGLASISVIKCQKKDLQKCVTQHFLMMLKVKVRCDMTNFGGGWTVIQRRGDFSNDEDYFDKTLDSYIKG